ncbi:MAG: glutamate dehydrogenase, partial [Pirellulales bacterium]|nr:glutamate dehydrogenase [Pirellulales bacterium]
GRREATGRGVVATIAAACEYLNLDLTKQRVAVQGFGNVGSVAAADVARLGASVVAVSDISGGTANPDGLDLPKLLEHVAATGAVKGFAGGADVLLDEVLEADCDILIPAAAQSAVTGENAGRVRARMIAEGANGPLTPEADDVLAQRDVFIIPDILCNAGGVFVSYLEYTQETQRDQMTQEEVEQRLNRRMRDAFDQVSARAEKTGLPMRQAAMDLAVMRVVDGITARGLLP